MGEFGLAALLRDPGYTDIIRAEWPLHITITPNFILDASIDRVIGVLSPVIATAAPMTVGPGPEADFGPGGEHRVVLVDPPDALTRLHAEIDRVLAANGSRWVSPFRGADYRPHATVTNGIRLTDEEPIDSVVYIEIAPGGDPGFARILGRQKFGETRVTAPLVAARHDDAAGIVALRDAAARWQRDRGIIQWSPGEMPLSAVEAEIARGEWWVVRRAPQAPLAGAVRIVDDDPVIWPTARDGGYVHGLMVARDRMGDGLGARILAAAETEIERRGRTWARLDCVASNAVLRGYYAARGYQECGIHEYPSGSGWQPSALFEKRLTPR